MAELVPTWSQDGIIAMHEVFKELTLRGNVIFVDQGVRLPRSEVTCNVTFVPLGGRRSNVTLYRLATLNPKPDPKHPKP